MPSIEDDLPFPEPRRSALRALLLEHVEDVGDAARWPEDAYPLGDLPAPPHGPTTAPRRSWRLVTVAAVAALLIAATLALVATLPRERDGVSPRPAATVPTARSSDPSLVSVSAVAPIDPAGRVASGWTASSCPLLGGDDPAGLLGADVGAVWSGTSTPVRCRVYSPSGAPLLDVTTLPYDSPGEAGDIAAALAGAGDQVQPTRRVAGATPDVTATVIAFRTEGLTGHASGWAVSVAQGSSVFLVRAAGSLQQATVYDVAVRIVDTATGPGGSALTTALRSCARLAGLEFSTALVGGQVTCGFGGGHPEEVTVIQAACPDGTAWFAFSSSAADATDHTTYYGSPATVLMSSTAPATVVLASAAARQRSCP